MKKEVKNDHELIEELESAYQKVFQKEAQLKDHGTEKEMA